MYTVKELIETLQKCPEDYAVLLHTESESFNIECVGIDRDEETVDLFAE